MALLTRNQIKEIVKKALKKVADFNGDIEEFPDTDFISMPLLSKQKFLQNLKIDINDHQYYNPEGQEAEGKHYDVSLSINEFENWSNITDCINYIKTYHTAMWNE
ncbi:hypothetical protein KCTC32516_01724 [Polaribacter huanghezhanensis]|uniref:hypothetical protein n=1 Tax=Polaribacter huanghezhanensis TaxID=1354726 RepID=UPI002649CFD0|nr:hypothetical protein [Polaribacter huanghezhanensis]WKD86349.1 hypothetical protein KCTC32516_01724 [Polaribacter huanghezhanensis]